MNIISILSLISTALSVYPLQGSTSIGYTYAQLPIGTPPQQQSFIVDTGSSKTVIPCLPYQPDSQKANQIFDPEISSTFKNMNKKFQIFYAEGSSVTGHLAQDIIHGMMMEIGCMEKSTGLIESQFSNGIMGLDKGGIWDRFGICIGREGGWIDFNQENSQDDQENDGFDIHNDQIESIIKSDEFQTVPALTYTQKWMLNLKDVYVGEQKVIGNWGETLLDSGNTYIEMKEDSFKNLLNMIQYGVKEKVNQSYQGGNCWKLDSDKDFEGFPDISFDISGKNYTISKGDYLFKNYDHINLFCLGIHSHGQFFNKYFYLQIGLRTFWEIYFFEAIWFCLTKQNNKYLLKKLIVSYQIIFHINFRKKFLFQNKKSKILILVMGKQLRLCYFLQLLYCLLYIFQERLQTSIKQKISFTHKNIQQLSKYFLQINKQKQYLVKRDHRV